MTRRARLGTLPGIVIPLMLTWALGTRAAIAILASAKIDPAQGPAVAGAALVLCLALMGLVLTLFRRVQQTQPGTPGRARVTLFCAGTILELSALLGVVGLLAWTLRDNAPAPLLNLLYALPPPFRMAAMGLVIAEVAGFIVMMAASMACWFLIPERSRRLAWAFMDVGLLTAFAMVTWRLPLTPQGDQPDNWIEPAIRLAVTTLTAARLTARFVPWLLRSSERFGFRPLIASRHLTARKTNFLAAIGLLSILAVAFSSCSLTTTLSVMGGFRNDLKQKILGNHAHVTIDNEEEPFEGWQPILERVAEIEGVRGVSAYANGEVMVTSATNLSGAVLRGVIPERIVEVSDLRRNMVEGRIEDMQPQKPSKKSQPTPPPNKNPPLFAGSNAAADLPGVLVGRELARALRMRVGDEIQVVSPLGDLGPTGPMPKSRPFRVAGIFYTGMYEYDMKYIYAELGAAQRFLSLGDAIHGIQVKVSELEQAPAAAQLIQKRAKGLRVRDWQETNRNLFGALALEKLAMFVTLGIAILVAGFCVFGTLTLMVQEKGREVAILKAMGATKTSIVALFLLEGLWIGSFGSAIGLGLGYAVVFAAEHIGFRISPEVYYIDKLPVHLDRVEFALVGIASLVVCVVATAFPAVIASRLKVVDALRYS